MRVPFVDVAAPVTPVVEPVDHFGRLGPTRSVRTSRHADRPWMVRIDRHAEGDLRAVRRPLDVAGAVLQVGDLRFGTLGVHPAHEDLGPFVVAAPGEEDAVSARRPLRRRSLREAALPRPVGVHDIHLGVAAVVDPVHPAAGVDDLGAVGRELRVRDPLPVEVGHELEGAVGLVLGGERRGQQEGGQKAGEQNGGDAGSGHRTLRGRDIVPEAGNGSGRPASGGVGEENVRGGIGPGKCGWNPWITAFQYGNYGLLNVMYSSH